MKEYDSPLGRSISSKGAMMLFNDQDRSGVVTPPRSEGSGSMGTEMLSAAKHDITGVGR